METMRGEWREILDRYSRLNAYLIPKIPELMKKNHPLLICIEKDRSIVQDLEYWLTQLQENPHAPRLMRSLFAARGVEQFQDVLAEIEFAAFFSGKGYTIEVVARSTHGTPDLCLSKDREHITVEIKRLADPCAMKDYIPGTVITIDDIRKVHSKIDDSLKSGQYFDNIPHILLFKACPGFGEDEIVDLLYPLAGTCKVEEMLDSTFFNQYIIPNSGIFIETGTLDETSYDILSGIIISYPGYLAGIDLISGSMNIKKPRTVFYPNPHAKHSLNRNVICELGLGYYDLSTRRVL